MSADGEWAPKRHKGPSTYRTWCTCWRVFEAAMTMLRVASPTTLERYFTGIATLVEWCPTSWEEISTADEIVRREQWPMMLEIGLATLERGPSGTMEPRRRQDADTWDSIIFESAFRAAGQGELGEWWILNLTKPLDRAGRGSTAAPPPTINAMDGSIMVRGAGGGQQNRNDGKGSFQQETHSDRSAGSGQGDGCPNCGEAHPLERCGKVEALALGGCAPGQGEGPGKGREKGKG